VPSPPCLTVQGVTVPLKNNVLSVHLKKQTRYRWSVENHLFSRSVSVQEGKDGQTAPAGTFSGIASCLHSLSKGKKGKGLACEMMGWSVQQPPESLKCRVY